MSKTCLRNLVDHAMPSRVCLTVAKFPSDSNAVTKSISYIVAAVAGRPLSSASRTNACIKLLTKCRLRRRVDSSLESAVKRNASTTVNNDKGFKVCVVGSGPAGFYTAQHLLRHSTGVQVNILEKYPAPFGLVRYGVAPDHPEVKNVIHSFSLLAKNPNFKLYGNVSVGTAVSVHDLLKFYHAVVLAYGAARDRKLNIEGEDGPDVLPSRNVVGWYNGVPEDRKLIVNLQSTDTAVIIGHGNVALDVARILLTPVDVLRKTDITDFALDALQKSKIKRVFLVGRRGPAQVAFTIKELRELIRLDGCDALLDPADFTQVRDHLANFERPRKRLTTLLVETADQNVDLFRSPKNDRQWHLLFNHSPIKIIRDAEDNSVKAVDFMLNELDDPLSPKARIIATGRTRRIDCGLVIRSVGYQTLPVEAGLPFDERRNIIPNQNGRAIGCSGLYCSGWVKSGPVGVINATMQDSFETAQTILADVGSGQLSSDSDDPREGDEAMLRVLKSKGVVPVLFDDWEHIDHAEVLRGKDSGKPREKLTDVEEMLRLAASKVSEVVHKIIEGPLGKK